MITPFLQTVPQEFRLTQIGVQPHIAGDFRPTLAPLNVGFLFRGWRLRRDAFRQHLGQV
jgi:hypothetical protein